jgi:hypothetical protein
VAARKIGGGGGSKLTPFAFSQVRDNIHQTVTVLL